MISKYFRKSVFVIILAASLLSENAFSVDEDWTVKKLMEQLSEVKFVKLNFVEIKQSIFLVTDITIEGEMEYRAPDYIAKNTNSPFTEKVVIDGDSMVIKRTTKPGKVEATEQIQKYSVQSQPLLKAVVESIRAMLAGNFDTLAENYTFNIEGQEDDWSLDLLPKEQEILDHIEQINLKGEGVRIKEFLTVQADGDESLMSLTYQQVE